MGWDYWGYYGCGKDTPNSGDVGPSESLVHKAADTLVSSGLRDAGYNLIRMDDCWLSSSRTPDGHLQANSTLFPSGMQSLGDYIHNASSTKYWSLPIRESDKSIEATTMASPGASLPAVYPVPQSITATGSATSLSNVVVVSGSDTDYSAFDAVTSALRNAGAGPTSYVVSSLADAANVTNDVEVVLGTVDDNPAMSDTLNQLGQSDASGLAAGGYVIATGTVSEGSRTHHVIALNGHDAAGTFYAVQTLRQLIEAGTPATIPGVVVRDWPTTAVRGVVEGFYGAPWSDTERAQMFQFMGRNKMNSYVYGPKQDTMLRDSWQTQYSSAQLTELGTLVTDASQNHVTFTYMLSPGKSICFATDEPTIQQKLDQAWQAGVRSFSIGFDDIVYTALHCTQDSPATAAGAGARQAKLMNDLVAYFKQNHPTAAPLQIVPTEYSDVASSDYKTALGSTLDSSVVINWTGNGVTPQQITPTQVDTIQAAFGGHPIQLWDNYPVNDSSAKKPGTTDPLTLWLGPYEGRQIGLGAKLAGITANPMVEPEASQIPLFTIADDTWNDAAYNPTSSWQAGVNAVAGSSATARTALAAFADLSYRGAVGSPLPTPSPALKALVDQFLTDWRDANPTDATTYSSWLTDYTALDSYLTTLETTTTSTTQSSTVPPTCTSTVGTLPAGTTTSYGALSGLSTELQCELRPWLLAVADWAKAADYAIKAMKAKLNNTSDLASDLSQAQTWLTTSDSYGKNFGAGVTKTLITTAVAIASGKSPIGYTSMPVYSYGNDVPVNMSDGDLTTSFMTSQGPSVGDWFEIDLGGARSITSVTVAMDAHNHVGTGKLEASADDKTWSRLGTVSGVAMYTYAPSAPPATKYRYLRVTVTVGTGTWIQVNEFRAATT